MANTTATTGNNGAPQQSESSSSKRVAANRNNAQRSTGPKTEPGKRASSQNPVRHGLTARTVVLSDEEESAFVDLCQRLRDEKEPQGVQEEELVDRQAEMYWNLRRVARLRAEILESNRRQATRQYVLRLLDQQPGPDLSALSDYLAAQQAQLQEEMRAAEGKLAAPAGEEAASASASVSHPALSQSLDEVRKLHEALRSALTPDHEDAALRLQIVNQMEKDALARDLEGPLGASLGGAYLLDAEGADALSKLDRHEATIYNLLAKNQRLFDQLQGARQAQG